MIRQLVGMAEIAGRGSFPVAARPDRARSLARGRGAGPAESAQGVTQGPILSVRLPLRSPVPSGDHPHLPGALGLRV